MGITLQFSPNVPHVFGAPQNLVVSTDTNNGPWPVDMFMGFNEDITVSCVDGAVIVPEIGSTSKTTYVAAGAANIQEDWSTTTVMGRRIQVLGLGPINEISLDKQIGLSVELGASFGPGAPSVINEYAAVESILHTSGQVLITSAIGFHAKAASFPAPGVVTNLYGVLVDDVTAGTNNFAIKTGLGKVSLGDNVDILGALVVTRAAGNASITIGSGIQTNSYHSLNAAAGSERYFRIFSGSSLRWLFGATPAAEGGADSGSPLSLFAYTDAGGLIDSPISILRASGATMTFGGSTGRMADFTGDVNVQAGRVFKVASTRVVGPRRTGWTAQTAAVSRADLGAAPTTGQLASFCSALYADLAAHGLIG